MSKNPGENAKQLGLLLVEMHNQPWIEQMRAVAIDLFRRNGSLSIDDLRKWADENNRQPASEKAWGAIFKGLEWTPIGTQKSRYYSNHCRNVFIWAYTPEKANVKK